MADNRALLHSRLSWEVSYVALALMHVVHELAMQNRSCVIAFAVCCFLRTGSIEDGWSVLLPQDESRGICG